MSRRKKQLVSYQTLTLWRCAKVAFQEFHSLTSHIMDLVWGTQNFCILMRNSNWWLYLRPVSWSIHLMTEGASVREVHQHLSAQMRQGPGHDYGKPPLEVQVQGCLAILLLPWGRGEVSARTMPRVTMAVTIRQLIQCLHPLVLYCSSVICKH